MRELVRTNDIVLVSAVGALLDGAHIHHLVLDQNMSIIEGSLGVFNGSSLETFDNGISARGASMLQAGPTVAGGMLYVNSGYGDHGGRPGNVLLAFEVRE